MTTNETPSSSSSLVDALRNVVGDRHLITQPDKQAPYCTGFRFGSGSAIAVLKPGTLLELWQALRHCVEHDVIVVMQAANTGLTGGSTPNGDDYDRDVVVINTMRIDAIQIIAEGRQIIGLAGSTLFGLEQTLEPYGREPHSVIGSSCIGASIVGGICNNSGGALVQRGPAYTELSLFARIDDDGRIELDTNPVERAMRPIALNRKNALFAGHDVGAQNWAAIASLIETCKLNAIDPHAYLCGVLTAIAGGHKQNHINELLPWNYTKAV